MKIAIVQMWSEPWVDNRTGGLIYAPMILQANLQDIGVESDIVFFSSRRRPDPTWHPAYQQLQMSEVDKLNEYDAAIFTSAGSFQDRKKGAWWELILDRIQVPFVVWSHDEAEIRALPYRERFYDHPMCRMILGITEGILLTLVGQERLEKQHWGVYPAHPHQMGFFSRPQTEKQPQVVTTCRLTSRKRLLEFVRDAAPGIAEAGFDVHVWGSESSYFYKKKLEAELLNYYWDLKGHFDRSQLPEILEPAMFHYNAPWLKKTTFFPRIEIATLEAVQFGCCPVLCRESTPGWVTEDHAVFVSFQDPESFRTLGKRLKAVSHKAPTLSAAFRQAYQDEMGMRYRTERLVEVLGSRKGEQLVAD